MSVWSSENREAYTGSLGSDAHHTQNILTHIPFNTRGFEVGAAVDEFVKNMANGGDVLFPVVE